MFIIITLLLTVLVSGIFGAVPAVVSRRRVSRRDAAWAAGLWLAVWVFALCAYHRPGLTVGFHAFRLVALTAMTGWAGLVTAGLRSLGRKGLKAVVPLLAVTALGLEVFVGNVAYFNTHSYEPFQLVDYLDENINVGRGLGTISLDEDRTYLRFLDIDQPIYNLRFDGLVSDDTEPLHADSAVIFTIEGTDAANTELTRFGSWQVGLQAPRTQVISLDLTGSVGMLTLTAAGYSSTYAQFPVALTFRGITANAPRALDFSILRFCAIYTRTTMFTPGESSSQFSRVKTFTSQPPCWALCWLPSSWSSRSGSRATPALPQKITTPRSGTGRARSASSTSSTARWRTAC